MFRRGKSWFWFLCAFGLIAPCAAFANDGGIAFGGSPDLLTQHPTISMENEVVRITVGPENVTADCTFRFRNRGPACTVRMGFPDVGEGAEDPDEEGIKNPPRSTFTSFKSYVDGKPVKTELIRAKQEGHFWHAKMVQFPANGALTVRDVYTQPVGGQIGMHNTNIHQIGYVLHTGASWHGPIGRTEVQIKFQRPGMSALKPGTKGNGIEHDAQLAKHPSQFYYLGPCAPKIEGNSVRFVRENWRPTPQDDIRLYFDVKQIGS